MRKKIVSPVGNFLFHVGAPLVLVVYPNGRTTGSMIACTAGLNSGALGGGDGCTPAAYCRATAPAPLLPSSSSLRRPEEGHGGGLLHPRGRQALVEIVQGRQLDA